MPAPKDSPHSSSSRALPPLRPDAVVFYNNKERRYIKIEVMNIPSSACAGCAAENLTELCLLLPPCAHLSSAGKSDAGYSPFDKLCYIYREL